MEVNPVTYTGTSAEQQPPLHLSNQFLEVLPPLTRHYFSLTLLLPFLHSVQSLQPFLGGSLVSMNLAGKQGAVGSVILHMSKCSLFLPRTQIQIYYEILSCPSVAVPFFTDFFNTPLLCSHWLRLFLAAALPRVQITAFSSNTSG